MVIQARSKTLDGDQDYKKWKPSKGISYALKCVQIPCLCLVAKHPFNLKLICLYNVAQPARPVEKTLMA
jgi:hypothetical protein